MKSKSIMIQGTGSSVGKSIICAALCRIFTQDGYNVNPFKSQNMSSIFHVTKDGNKIAISQALQAYACKKEPLPIMNPVLLIPTADNKSQVILTGEFYKEMEAEEYFSFKPLLKEKIAAVYQQLSQDSDIVIIEGAGSPAEINLKREDFVNMGMAKIADAPVILVGDIDRGGVFASLAGTMLLLDDEERNRVKGVIINKFRGSYKLLEPGLRMLEEIIKVPVLGVIPYMQHNLPEEDSLGHMHSHQLAENIDNEKQLDLIADLVRNSLNMDKIYEILEA